MRKHIANIITSCRILCSILLLFFSPISVEFYIIYLLCGFSDMIDGTVARKVNCISEFGTIFDTVADFIFAAVALLKILPILDIPIGLWVWFVAITIIKTSNIILGFIRSKKFIALHTIMNKFTGMLLFLLPLTLHFIEPLYSCAVVCFLATFAAIQEGYYVFVGREKF